MLGRRYFYSSRQDLIGDLDWKDLITRSTSIFIQAGEILRLSDVETVLEVGSLRGILTSILKHFKISVTTADIEEIPFLNSPDHLCSLDNLKSATSQRFDLVCAFQVLEHNPVEKIEEHLLAMKDLSNKYVFISLPYDGFWFTPFILCNLPKTNKLLKAISNIFSFRINKPKIFSKAIQSNVNQEPTMSHQFELGSYFSHEMLISVANNVELKLIKMFFNPYYPYHQFFLFKKNEP